jgi:hypothetical protein
MTIDWYVYAYYELRAALSLDLDPILGRLESIHLRDDRILLPGEMQRRPLFQA